MKFRSQLLSEAVYKFKNSDIDKIMSPIKKYREEIFEILQNGSIEDVNDYFNDRIEHLKYLHDEDIYIIKTLDSSIFKDSPLADAHKINPIKIHIGFPEISHYNIQGKAVVVGIRRGQLEDASGSGWDLGQLSNYYTMPKVRSDMIHELTHWLDDTFHKKFLTKKFSKEGFIEKYIKKGEKAYIEDPFEINSVINGIADMKKLLEKRISKDIWDILSWDDFLGLDPFLANLDVRHGVKFRRVLKKRMFREKLLGKNMK